MINEPPILPHAGWLEWLAALHSNGENAIFNTLIILIIADIITGIIKSFSIKGGGLDSTIGRKGGAQHLLTLVLMFILYPWSIAIGYKWLGDIFLWIWIGFYINSIVENVGQMGLPLPKYVKDRLKKLKDDGGESDDKNSKNQS